MYRFSFCLVVFISASKTTTLCCMARFFLFITIFLFLHTHIHLHTHTHLSLLPFLSTTSWVSSENTVYYHIEISPKFNIHSFPQIAFHYPKPCVLSTVLPYLQCPLPKGFLLNIINPTQEHTQFSLAISTNN